MNAKRSSLLLVLLATCLTVDGRVTKRWTYQEMFDKSDVVVVGKPVSAKDTLEESQLPNLPDSKIIGIATEFRIRLTLKGEKDLKTLVLHHYRHKQALELGTDLANFVRFDTLHPQPYMLFLLKESDGRYAPVTGQIDPALFSIIKMESVAD